MKEQFISTSLITKNFISFKTECSCFAHDLHVRFEKDDKINQTTLYMEDKMYIEEPYSSNIFKRLWWRIKIALKILFKGFYEFDYEFCFKGDKHVEEFMKYMNDAYEEMKGTTKDENQV